MAPRKADQMRSFWDERARLNAAWYVDTSLDYNDPDLERFLATGDRVVEIALGGAPNPPQRRDAALDIGPGLGRISLALSKEFRNVIGVDVSEEMVRRAREMIPDPRIAFIVGDGTSLATIADSSIDFAVTFTVFQHIPQPAIVEHYIAETARVLRPGGVFVFQWANQHRHRLWALRRRAKHAMTKVGIGVDPYGRDTAQFLGSRIPLDRITHAVESAGLRVAKTDGLGTLFAWMWAEKPAAQPG